MDGRAEADNHFYSVCILEKGYIIQGWYSNGWNNQHDIKWKRQVYCNRDYNKLIDRDKYDINNLWSKSPVNAVLTIYA